MYVKDGVRNCHLVFTDENAVQAYMLDVHIKGTFREQATLRSVSDCHGLLKYLTIMEEHLADADILYLAINCTPGKPTVVVAIHELLEALRAEYEEEEEEEKY